MRVFAALIALAIALVPAQAMAAGPRIALVVGNDDYSGGLHQLTNAAKDAHLITGILQQAGFEVIERPDANRATMAAAIKSFTTRLEAAGPGAVGLFYFAGHGLQSYGTNYLLATDAAIDKPDDISRFGFEADDVLRAMASGGADINILFIDACRPNDVSKILRPVAAEGLREADARGIDKNRSVLLAYSTGLGETAADGDDGNGPFAKALAANLLTPDLPLDTMLFNVRVQMVRNGHQKPWTSNGMVHPFAFVGKSR